MLRKILLEWPAKAFNAWWRMYSLFLIVMIMIVFTVTVIAIVLDHFFGIRWGW